MRAFAYLRRGQIQHVLPAVSGLLCGTPARVERCVSGTDRGEHQRNHRPVLVVEVCSGGFGPARDLVHEDPEEHGVQEQLWRLREAVEQVDRVGRRFPHVSTSPTTSAAL